MGGGERTGGGRGREGEGEGGLGGGAFGGGRRGGKGGGSFFFHFGGRAEGVKFEDGGGFRGLGARGLGGQGVCFLLSYSFSFFLFWG